MQTQINFHIENNQESQAIFNGNIEHFSNQCRIVYEAMKRGERLTTTDALIKYGIGDLRRRVKDLRDNYKIDVKSELQENRFKTYYLWHEKN